MAVKDASTALKTAVASRFTERRVSTTVLAEHEEDPDTYEKPLAKGWSRPVPGTTPRIVELAQALMRLMDQDDARTGKYTVDVRGAGRADRRPRHPAQYFLVPDNPDDHGRRASSDPIPPSPSPVRCGYSSDSGRRCDTVDLSLLLPVGEAVAGGQGGGVVGAQHLQHVGQQLFKSGCCPGRIPGLPLPAG